MRTLISALILFSLNYLVAQPDQRIVSPWKIISSAKAEAARTPAKKTQFLLDLEQLKRALSKTPQRFAEQVARAPIKVLFPLPNGELQAFSIVEASNFHPKLAVQFPAIQSFAGMGLDDPTARLRFDISPRGLHAMIRSGRHSSVFIDPLRKGNREIYTVFYKKNQVDKAANFACTLKRIFKEQRGQNTKANARAGDCQFRTYRLALACTAEYAQFHGGTVADALAAMNTTLTRINGIFENDLSITLQLVENNTRLIFLNASADPYSNNDIVAMLDENQETCDALIGSANYDIGHVFGTRGGGIAFLGVVCENRFKASGATGFEQPRGAIFDVDLASHEMGHQFGADHTFNGSQGACSGGNRNNATAVEPGGGSTIMSYAGICNQQNIQNNSDAYFHAISLHQIGDYVSSAGNSCPQTNSTNSKPVANHSGNTFFIPKSTPFVLSGEGTDREGNKLTYIWEQMDNGIAPQPPSSSNEVGPLFRSLPPSTSATRYFPDLRAIINRDMLKWEVLPSVAREMNFRLTVRDNQLEGGCTNETDVQLMVTNAGPFEVIVPNTALTWGAGSQQTVFWNPAGTAAAPINAATVDILMSIDGGLTYPITLWENTLNDGEQVVLVPNTTTTIARIMVKASDNVFFDISDQNFIINRLDTDFALGVMPISQTVCSPESGIYDVDISGGFNGTVTLSTTGLPNVAAVVFSENPIHAPGPLTLTIGNTKDFSGAFNFQLIANAADGEKIFPIHLEVLDGAPGEIPLVMPEDALTQVSVNPVFSWSQDSNAETYRLEIATDLTFRNLVERVRIDATSFQLANPLEEHTTYYWRVAGINLCGNGLFSDVFSFTTEGITIPITLQATIQHPRCFGDNNGAISLQVTGGSGNYTYLWENGNQTSSITGLTAGDYPVTISDGISNKDTTFIIEAPPILNVDASVFPPPCFGENEGRIEIRVNGGTLPYQFQWSNGSKLSNLSNLSSGTYSLTVTDNNACEMIVSHTLEEPARLILGHTSMDVNCSGGKNGAIYLTLSDEDSNLHFQWSNGATTSALTSLNAGDYSVTVTSTAQCSEILETTIRQPAEELSTTFEQSEPSCNGGMDGMLRVIVHGGQAPYQYLWSTGATTPTINGLSAGNYRLTVSDALACSKENSFNLLEPTSFTLEVIELTDAPCTGEGGSVKVAAFNAEGSVQYLWSNGNTGSNQNDLIVGKYRVTATDGRTCESILEIDISEEEDINPPVLGTQSAKIYLDHNGQGNLSAAQLDDGSTDDCGVVSLAIDREHFDCNSLGNQQVRVTATDANANQSSALVVVEVLDTVAPAFTCPGLIIKNNCKNVIPSDYPSARDNCGTPTVNLVQEGEEGFVDGENQLTFKAVDAAGNYAFCTVPLIRNNTLNATILYESPTCQAAADGTATVFPTGGTPPYTFLWNDPNHQTTQTAMNLAKGTYFVGIVDASSCAYFAEVTLDEPAQISIIEEEIIEERNDNRGGAIAVNVSGGNPPYRFEWFFRDSSIARTKDITGLKSGDYTLVVEDVNGCAMSKVLSVGQLIVSVNGQTLSEQILLFPNPTKGLIWLGFESFKNEKTIVELFDITGRRLLAGINLGSKKYPIDLSDFPNGVYFVKIRIGEEAIIKKVILTN